MLPLVCEIPLADFFAVVHAVTILLRTLSPEISLVTLLHKSSRLSFLEGLLSSFVLSFSSVELDATSMSTVREPEGYETIFLRSLAFPTGFFDNVEAVKGASCDKLELEVSCDAGPSF